MVSLRLNGVVARVDDRTSGGAGEARFPTGAPMTMTFLIEANDLPEYDGNNFVAPGAVTRVEGQVGDYAFSVGPGYIEIPGLINESPIGIWVSRSDQQLKTRFDKIETDFSRTDGKIWYAPLARVGYESPAIFKLPSNSNLGLKAEHNDVIASLDWLSQNFTNFDDGLMHVEFTRLHKERPSVKIFGRVTGIWLQRGDGAPEDAEQGLSALGQADSSLTKDLCPPLGQFPNLTGTEGIWGAWRRDLKPEISMGLTSTGDFGELVYMRSPYGASCKYHFKWSGSHLDDIYLTEQAAGSNDDHECPYKLNFRAVRKDPETLELHFDSETAKLIGVPLQFSLKGQESTPPFVGMAHQVDGIDILGLRPGMTETEASQQMRKLGYSDRTNIQITELGLPFQEWIRGGRASGGPTDSIVLHFSGRTQSCMRVASVSRFLVLDPPVLDELAIESLAKKFGTMKKVDGWKGFGAYSIPSISDVRSTGAKCVAPQISGDTQNGGSHESVSARSETSAGLMGITMSANPQCGLVVGAYFDGGSQRGIDVSRSFISKLRVMVMDPTLVSVGQRIRFEASEREFISEKIEGARALKDVTHGRVPDF